MWKTNVVLIAIVVLMVILPLGLIGHKAEFSGADDQGTDAITEVQPGYQPWFEPIWEPPSGEIESLFFALQAGLGAGFIGYFIGLSKGRRMATADRKTA